MNNTEKEAVRNLTDFIDASLPNSRINKGHPSQVITPSKSSYMGNEYGLNIKLQKKPFHVQDVLLKKTGGINEVNFSKIVGEWIKNREDSIASQKILDKQLFLNFNIV